MKKKLLLLSLLLILFILVGCSTIVPQKQPFPIPPDALMVPPLELKTIKDTSAKTGT